MIKTTLALAGVLAFAGLASAEPAKTAPAAPAAPAMKGLDIVDTAMSTGMHNTLAAAIKHCGLVEALKGKGPFTVFAPTDEAFGKLPAGTLDTLMKEENKGKLTDILKFHVIAGAAVKAADVVKMKESVPTLQGQKFNIVVKDGKVTIGNKAAMANVIKTDVECSNGVIHVIDAVIMPEAEKSEGEKGAGK